MKLKSAVLACTAAMCFSTIQAAPIALVGGPLFFQFNNLEQAGPGLATNNFASKDLNGDGVFDLIGGPGGTAEFNWGVFNVSTIQKGGVASPNEDISGGVSYFTDSANSAGQVHGIFYGFELNGATKLRGGYIDIYWTDGAQGITLDDLTGAAFAPSARTDWNVAGKFTQGALLARLKYAPGAIDGDGVTTVTSTVDPLNFSGTGLADGFANIVDINNDGKIDALDGAWAAALNTDWFFVDTNGNTVRGESGETRDLRFSTLFQNLNTWDSGAGIQGLRSNDPGRAFVAPEPSGLGLAALALLGAGILRRRSSQ